MFRKIPWHIWIGGFLIIICALYLIYHLTLGHFGVLFEGYREGHWWQYLIAVLMLIFGVIFMHAGKIEQVIFDKEIGILSYIKTSIFCKKKITDWAINQIQNIRIFKRGHDGIQVMTIHYAVQIDFKDAPSHTVLETQQKDKAIRQLVKIKEFLGLNINKSDLVPTDQSTSKYKRDGKM